MVFLGAISLYLSALGFLKRAQQNDVTTNPLVSLEDITKRISLSNSATLGTVVAGQLDVRADYAVCSYDLLPGSANNTGNDNYWHYRFVGGALRSICDNISNTIVAAGSPALINNVADPPNPPGSSFALLNPSASGNASVVTIHLVTSASPAVTIDTSVALGAASKN